MIHFIWGSQLGVLRDHSGHSAGILCSVGVPFKPSTTKASSCLLKSARVVVQSPPVHSADSLFFREAMQTLKPAVTATPTSWLHLSMPVGPLNPSPTVFFRLRELYSFQLGPPSPTRMKRTELGALERHFEMCLPNASA